MCEIVFILHMWMHMYVYIIYIDIVCAVFYFMISSDMSVLCPTHIIHLCTGVEYP